MSVASANPAQRWAVSVAPHSGGIHTFYRRFQTAVMNEGQSCISFEISGEAESWASYDRDAAGSGHQLVDVNAGNPKEAAQTVLQWLRENQINLLLLTPMSPWPVLDVIPHLPFHIRTVLRLTEISHHSYRRPLRTSGFDGLITLCPRQESDLKVLGLAQGLLAHRIPNGVDTQRFVPSEHQSSCLRLLVLDRLVHLQKRILFLPELLERLDQNMPSDLSWSLSVIGDGPDAPALDEKLKPWVSQGRVVRKGEINHSEVPDVMKDHDVYLKLSTNEGSPNAVLEAMASGLVPVAANIPGVTDFVIEDGISGRIVPGDDMRAMARAIVDLAQDETARRDMAKNARDRIEQNFSLRNFLERVVKLADILPDTSLRQPRSWDDFESCIPAQRSFIQRAIQQYLPLSLRKAIRENLAS